ncbi:Response regulator of zinc sigma-54-dependent two-component system [Labilithrix luteola]|uniref:Response regulator of zinc sigma-54-dependent two-component system n=1 Tax=Labilithrix luteola TaxID=1391654 RepID=A0A0K1Q572_9BACT|nr:sigma-54 dependent transcriptional regulator [Labilithrix luteola]AKV00981.1 Response regulator of zinc sigma-54-dependent two-component system [Labilithrix luteola]
MTELATNPGTGTGTLGSGTGQGELATDGASNSNGGQRTSGDDRSALSLRPDGEAPVRVLVVDDEDALRSTLARVLRQRGMETATAENGYVALDLLDKENFDVVLVDVRMPGITGPQVLQRIKAAAYPVEVVMMTAFADIATTVSAVKAGAYGFLTKPFVSNESVVIEVLNAAQYRRLRGRTDKQERTAGPTTPTGEMVGRCPPMREVYRLVSGVASTNSTILVLGESGTGKELVARAIHERSRRAARPLVTVNCAAIPRELVESELFGHTRGAFTSAVTARAGLFEAANGGTLFLDEIGDLPTSAQVKLLRTLQSGEIKPVGSDTIKTVDVRVIAATNADLRASIAAGTFRQDLFYRLNVIAIRLPPLRDRGDDILHLAQHFIQKHARIAGRPATRLSHEAALCLQRYEWPGNVRELEHAIEHAVVLSESETILPTSLPAEVQLAIEAKVPWHPPPGATPAPPQVALHVPAHVPAHVPLPAPAPAPTPPAKPVVGTMSELVAALGLAEMSYPEAKKRILADFNETYVNALLLASAGNMSEAARRSGLDRSNFRRLVRSTAPDSLQAPAGARSRDESDERDERDER